MDVKNKSIPELLFKMAPPVMLALLIQSIYNIADSFFVARYSTEGLTALSIIYPIQLLITALATGTGAGVNILISRLDGSGEKEAQQDIIKSGLILNFIHFLIFAFAGNLLADIYFSFSTGNALVKSQGILYSRIIFSGSIGLFTESICTKILQARGDMIVPMAAQITGSIVNIILDVILIFGAGNIPALGIYYKIQSFFFIPLLGFQQVLLPLFSYHYGAGDDRRNRHIFSVS